MTNEEAIRVLKAWDLNQCEEFSPSQFEKAFQMAIQALEQQPCDDAIEELSEMVDRIEKQLKEDKEELLNKLKAQLEFAKMKKQLKEDLETRPIYLTSPTVPQYYDL